MCLCLKWFYHHNFGIEIFISCNLLLLFALFFTPYYIYRLPISLRLLSFAERVCRFCSAVCFPLQAMLAWWWMPHRCCIPVVLRRRRLHRACCFSLNLWGKIRRPYVAGVCFADEKMIFIHHFSASFSYDSLVFDAQRFGIATRNPHRSWDRFSTISIEMTWLLKRLSWLIWVSGL